MLLAQMGLVRMQNFSQSKNKLRYVYLLVLARLVLKFTLVARFLRWVVAEYEALQIEIEALKVGVNAVECDLQ